MLGPLTIFTSCPNTRMPTVQANTNAEAVNNDTNHSLAATTECPLIGSDYGEKVSTIDQLPRGTALHVARTPLIKESPRTAQVSKQATGKGPSTSSSVSPEVISLKHSNSTASSLNNSDHEDTSPAVESVDSEVSMNNDMARKVSNGADLARRAARRVNVWKKSEQERRGEEERARQAKHEQEKRRQNHAAHVKQRRRAEIYALNALLRELQQEKVAQYIVAQKKLQEVQQHGDCKNQSGVMTTSALSQVRSVGA
ncbi:unnamed protein product [Phytophthora lilii]|uniref:Unnamed protein product n=1 Tax=Phytophthora lilii TaxID=2077276 RepID=A0A9W6U871_9STRA|nr:unnamed protein product [Phytophthora lilii]